MGQLARARALVHGVKALEKHRFRPRYALANLGHPSRTVDRDYSSRTVDRGHPSKTIDRGYPVQGVGFVVAPRMLRPN